MNLLPPTLLAAMVVASWSPASAMPPMREISRYPFIAAPERAARIRGQYTRVERGMSPGDVAAILGEADEVRPLYGPRAHDPPRIGYTQWYVLARARASGSVDQKQESLVRISFDLDDRVTRIDAWGL